MTDQISLLETGPAPGNAADPSQDLTISIVDRPYKDYPRKTLREMYWDAVQLDVKTFCTRYEIFTGGLDDVRAHLNLLSVFFTWNRDFPKSPDVVTLRDFPQCFWQAPEAPHVMPVGLWTLYYMAALFAGSARRIELDPSSDLEFLHAQANADIRDKDNFYRSRDVRAGA